VIAVLVSALSAQAPVAGEARSGWDRYRVFLWTFGDRKLDSDFFRTIKSVHITGINCEGPAASEAAAVKAAGLEFYAGHAVGKGILHLRKRDFELRWDAYWSDRVPRHLERPHCLSNPETVDRLFTRLSRSIEALSPHAPIAYSLDDEISITRRIVPLDFCFCEHCLAAFRVWLKERYASLAALNERWRTDFARWEDVVPCTTDRIKRRERRMPPQRWVLSPWDEHRAFMDHLLASTLARLRARARHHGVRVPIGFLGGQAPAPFGGYDWSRLLRAVDWVEAYDQGGAMEVVRGLAPGVIRVRTYFRTGDGEGRNRWMLWKYFAHGDRGAILWSDREIVDRYGQPTLYARGLAPALGALVSAKARAILSLPAATDGVALYYSQSSIRFAWMEDSRRDGRTWMKRFGSYEVKHSSHYRDREGWHRLLEDAGIQYGYVDADSVAAGRGLKGIRVLILPGVRVMGPAEKKGIRRFLDRGGYVIADRPGPALRSLFSSERALIMKANAAHYFERAGDDPEGHPALDEVVRLLARARVRSGCVARDADGKRGSFEVIRRPAQGGTYYFVLANPWPNREDTLTAKQWSRQRPVRLTFPAPVRARGVFETGSWEGETLEHEVAADRPWVFFVEQK
jgi:hypothetical protein